MFLECPAEIVDVVKAGSGSDLGHRQRAVAKQIIGFAEAGHRDVFGHRMAAKLLEQSAEMEAAEAGHIREQVDGQLVLKSFLDMLEDGCEALDVFHPFRILVLGEYGSNMAAKQQRQQAVQLRFNRQLIAEFALLQLVDDRMHAGGYFAVVCDMILQQQPVLRDRRYELGFGCVYRLAMQQRYICNERIVVQIG